MNTWNAAAPPDLPQTSLPGRLIGGVRVVGLVVATVLALGLFLLGRALRHLLGRGVVFHFGVARRWSRLCLWLAGLSLTVEGTPIRAGALVANHASWIDILALRAVRLIYFVSKAEVARWPGVGFLARVTGTVFIERRRAEAKRQEAVLRERMAHNQLICLFPEGTSTDSLRVLPFKSALFSAFFDADHGEPIAVQPVTIRYRPPPGLPDSFYGWWGGMAFEGHIWDVVTRSFGGAVHVTFHPALDASEFADRKVLAETAGRIVAAPFASGPAR